MSRTHQLIRRYEKAAAASDANRQAPDHVIDRDMDRELAALKMLVTHTPDSVADIIAQIECALAQNSAPRDEPNALGEWFSAAGDNDRGPSAAVILLGSVLTALRNLYAPTADCTPTRVTVGAHAIHAASGSA